MGASVQKYELSLKWSKSSAGYVWVDCEPCDVWGRAFKDWDEKERKNFSELLGLPPSGPFLVELDPRSPRTRLEPLENSLLFAEFADIPANQDSFLTWANKYGRLIDVDTDIENHYFIFPEHVDFSEETVWRSGGKATGLNLIKPDPLGSWLEEHSALSFAVMLWELLQNNDPRLNALIEWSHGSRQMLVNKIKKTEFERIDFDRFMADESYKCSCPVVQDVITNTQDGVNLPWLFKMGKTLDARKASLIYLQRLTTRKLAEYPVNVSFPDDVGKKPHNVLQPSNLLSAMWYQFYLVLAGEIRLRRCTICGKWENMEGHRSTWSKHANCANYGRVKRARAKKQNSSV